MRNPKIIIALVSVILLISSVTVYNFSKHEHQEEIPSGIVMAVGGANVSDEMRRHLVALSPSEDPNLLIIPQATSEKNWDNRGKQQAEVFSGLGVSRVEVLDLDDPEQAMEAIHRSDVFWMPGGSQQRLKRALDEAGVTKAIQDRFRDGIPVGGTSAGAAIMSDVMIASSSRDKETSVLTPVISRGLGFWPEVIIDQHFSERNRLERLEEAVKQHPELTGVGIDENTAVLFDGASFRVMGENSVTVVRAPDPEIPGQLEITVLHPGELYHFKSHQL